MAVTAAAGTRWNQRTVPYLSVYSSSTLPAHASARWTIYLRPLSTQETIWFLFEWELLCSRRPPVNLIGWSEPLSRVQCEASEGCFCKINLFFVVVVAVASLTHWCWQANSMELVLDVWLYDRLMIVYGLRELPVLFIYFIYARS